MPIRRIDYTGSTAGPEELGQDKALPNDQGTAPSSGFDTNDFLEVANQPSLLDAGLVGERAPLTESQHAEISAAATKLLADLPDIARSANYDLQKIADGVDSHIKTSLSQTDWAVLGNTNGVDIEALTFLVLMDASKSAQDDLKSIMDGVKAINKQKEGWRAAVDMLNQMTASLSDGDDDDK